MKDLMSNVKGDCVVCIIIQINGLKKKQFKSLGIEC